MKIDIVGIKAFPDEAIPKEPENTTSELTKREQFAGMAMQAYITGATSWTDGRDGGWFNLTHEEAAKEAVSFADALIKELEK